MILPSAGSRRALLIRVIALGLAGVLPVLAKRAAPPLVAPVERDGVRYTAPNDEGGRGYIRAVDAKTGKTLWDLTVYKVRIDPLLEKDVQHVYIRKLRLTGGKLVVEDESNRSFTVDPAKRAVE
jgi:hypothetical protein